jgi:hypothetical protein
MGLRRGAGRAYEKRENGGRKKGEKRESEEIRKEVEEQIVSMQAA